MPAVWILQNYLGLLFLVALIAWRCASSRAGFLGVVLWAYALMSALAVLFLPRPEFQGLEGAMKQGAAQAFVLALCLPMGALLIRKAWMPRVMRFFGYVATLDALAVLFHGSGLMNADTADTALIAALFPMAPVVFALPLMLFTIAWVGGRTAFLILGAQIVGYAIGFRSFKWLLPLPFVGLALFLFEKHGFFVQNLRLEHWRDYFSWWVARADHGSGTGLGTFEILGPMIDRAGKTGELMIQMHSDWLQIGFELGILGLGLALAFFGHLCLMAKDRPAYLAMLFGVAMFGLTYHPLHIFIPAFFVCCLIREVIDFEPQRRLRALPKKQVLKPGR